MEDKKKSIISLHFFQRGEIFKIKSIDAFVKPELYKLEDLLGTEIKGNFYAKQLRLAPNGDDPDFVFEVEAILKKRKVRGVEQILVKYLYYPGKNITFETLLSIRLRLCYLFSSSVCSVSDKFNQWIPKSQLVVDNSTDD